MPRSRPFRSQMFPSRKIALECHLKSELWHRKLEKKIYLTINMASNQTEPDRDLDNVTKKGKKLHEEACVSKWTRKKSIKIIDSQQIKGKSPAASHPFPTMPTLPFTQTLIQLCDYLHCWLEGRTTTTPDSVFSRFIQIKKSLKRCRL